MKGDLSISVLPLQKDFGKKEQTNPNRINKHLKVSDSFRTDSGGRSALVLCVRGGSEASVYKYFTSCSVLVFFVDVCLLLPFRNRTQQHIERDGQG